MSKIIGIGETVLDIIFKNDRPYAAIPGGSTFNSMISLGRTAGRLFEDCRILMITETGDDHTGDIITDFMEANGVSTEGVTRNRGTQSHVTLAFLDENNDADYEFYKDHAHASLVREKVESVSFSSDDIVLFGSFFSINPQIRTHTASLLHKAHDAGATLYYDVNFRKSHVPDIPDTLGNIRENMSLSSIVRGSVDDFGYLFGTKNPVQIYEQHISEYCRTFICTCGAGPVHIFTPGRHLEFPVSPIATVSTIGAGDNFNSGLIFSLVRDGVRTRLDSISDKRWEHMVSTAGMFSSEVCRSLYNYVGEDFYMSLR